MFCRHVFGNISGGFRVFRVFWGISRKHLNFAGPRPREISEALDCKKHIFTDLFLFFSPERRVKVLLHGTIRNDDFKRNTELQCWNNVATIRNNVPTVLQHCVALKIVVANRPV